MIQIHCMPDHAHIFIGLNPKEAISDLMRDLKRDSTNFINEVMKPPFHFSWQEGFGAFSYSKESIGNVARYIQNQVEHHKRKNFEREYRKLLREFDIPFDPRYVFHPHGTDSSVRIEHQRTNAG
jgi:REP element-mobilizing transposase RayT